MGKTSLIIQREYYSRVKKKSFIIMSLLGPVLIAGFMALATYFSMPEEKFEKVWVMDYSGFFYDENRPETLNIYFKESEKISFYYDSTPYSKDFFEASPYTLALEIPENIVESRKINILFKELPGINSQEHITTQVQKEIEKVLILKEGLDVQAYNKIRREMQVAIIDMNEEGEESTLRLQASVGFAFGYTILFFILFYGIQVMRGVMEEKNNRVVEVLISSVKPFQLMMGKIVGIALVGLTQFLIWILLSGILSAVLMPLISGDTYSPENISEMQVATGLEIPTASINSSGGLELVTNLLDNLPLGTLLISFVLFFMGGYLLYASFYAAIGAAVDNESDSQQFMFPVVLPLILGIIISTQAINNPVDSSIIIGSYVPFTSPIVMLVRIATNTVLWWEILLSLAILVGTFICTTWLSGKIYRTGILMYGKKIGYKELWKWIRRKQY